MHIMGGNQYAYIFVFQSGNIIITGAKNSSNILEAYEYITNLLRKYKNSIQKSKIAEILMDNVNDELKELLQIDNSDDLLDIALSDE